MTAIFECKSEFDINVEQLFSFHEEPIGFETLVGLDKNVRVVQAPKNIFVGAKAIIEVQILPFVKKTWVAKHTGYEKNKFFIDEQESGPFKSFKHTHSFEQIGNKSILIDHIEFEFYINFISKYFVVEKLKTQFKERHTATSKTLNTNSKLIFVGLIS